MLNLFRSNLRKIFYSPFCFLLSFLFASFCSLYFFLETKFFSAFGTADLHRFFQAMPYASILILPAFTTLLPHSGRDEELPFSAFEFAFAKIGTLFSSFVALALVPCIFLPICVSFFGSPDFSLVVCGFLGMLFFLLASFSMTVLISSLIIHPGVAFLVSAVVLFAVNFIHIIPQLLNLGNALFSVVHAISFAWHFDSFSKGILDSRDILFYILCAASFYVCTVLLIETKRGRLSFFTKKIIFPSVCALVLLFIDSGLYYFRSDASSSKQFSVSKQSRELLSCAEATVSILYYRSPLLKNLYPQIADVEEYLVNYASSSSRASLSILDSAKNEDTLRSLGIPGQNIQTASTDQRSYATVYSAIVIGYLDATEVIPFVLDTSTLEFDLTMRLSKLIEGNERPLQIVVGNGMKLSEDYSYVVPWLTSQGFSCQQTYMPSESSGFAKPSFTLFPDVPLLVLGTVHFDFQDALALTQRILLGNKTLVCTTPYTIDLKNEWQVIEAFDDDVIFALERFGIHFPAALTCDISNFPLAMYSDSDSGGARAEPVTEYVNYPLWPVLLPQKNAMNGMTTFWPSAMSLYPDVALTEGFSLKNFLVTSPGAWLLEKTGNTFLTNPFAVPAFPEDRSSLSERTLAALLEKEGEPCTMVWGDQYSIHSSLIAFASSESADIRSLEFLSDSLLLLNGEGAVLNLKHKNQKDRTLYKVEQDSLSSRSLPTIVLELSLQLAYILCCSAIVAVLRKRRRLT